VVAGVPRAAEGLGHAAVGVAGAGGRASDEARNRRTPGLWLDWATGTKVRLHYNWDE
jgi:hypothetical protein